MARPCAGRARASAFRRAEGTHRMARALGSVFPEAFASSSSGRMHFWPWMGFGAAIVLLVLLFDTNVLCSTEGGSRWRDPTWFAWLCAVAYMVHNVEEYGIDITGTSLAFPQMMEGLMGQIPAWTFFLCVNLALVWVMGPLATHLSRRWPVLCFGMVGIETINCLTHIPGAIVLGAVGGGFFTAVLLFLPLVIWAFVGLCGKGRFSYRRLAVFLCFGLLYHIGLFANMPFFVNGIYDGNVMGVEMVCVSVVVFTLWVWYAKRARKAGGSQNEVPALF